MSTYTHGRRRRRSWSPRPDPCVRGGSRQPDPAAQAGTGEKLSPAGPADAHPDPAHAAASRRIPGCAGPPILVVRPQSPRRFSQPIITRTPAAAEYPATDPAMAASAADRPRLYAAGQVAAHLTPYAIRPAASAGNAGPGNVGRWRPGPPAIRPRIYRTPLAQASGQRASAADRPAAADHSLRGSGRSFY